MCIIGSVSFLLSTFLIHYNENILTQFFYMVTGLWLAVGWHIIMTYILVWLIIGVRLCIQKNDPTLLDRKKIAIGAIICALLWSGYGIWCAFHPKVIHITVHIKDLPEQWKNKTAVQLSDVHLGNIYGSKFFAKVIARVNAEHPDIVFITGDLFDGMDSKLEHLVAPINDLTAPDGIYFVTGNHETYVGVENVIKTIENTPAHLLNDEMIHVADMQIVGVSYPERGVEKDITQTIKNMKNFNPQEPSILLYHTPVGASSAQDAGINLQLAGHTHRGQLFPFQLITRSIYGIYYHGLVQKDHFAMYTSSGVGTWGPPMRTSGRPEIVVIHFK